MNLQGIKKLLRNERQQLQIKVYDIDSGERLYEATFGEFRQQNCPYDRCEVQWIICNFNLDAHYEWEEEVLAGFQLSVAVDTEICSEESQVSMAELSELLECEWRTTYNRLLADHLKYRLSHLSKYSHQEQQKILARLQAYGELPADYIMLHFDVDKMYSYWVDAEEGLDNDEDYDELMSIDMYPVLPEGVEEFE